VGGEFLFVWQWVSEKVRYSVIVRGFRHNRHWGLVRLNTHFPQGSRRRAADSLQEQSLQGISSTHYRMQKNNRRNELNPSPQFIHPSRDHLAKNPDLELKVSPQGVSQKSTGTHVGLSTCVGGADSEHA